MPAGPLCCDGAFSEMEEGVLADADSLGGGEGDAIGGTVMRAEGRIGRGEGFERYALQGEKMGGRSSFNIGEVEGGFKRLSLFNLSECMLEDASPLCEVLLKDEEDAADKIRVGIGSHERGKAL